MNTPALTQNVNNVRPEVDFHGSDTCFSAFVAIIDDVKVIHRTFKVDKSKKITQGLLARVTPPAWI